jgi:hypothetical protein
MTKTSRNLLPCRNQLHCLVLWHTHHLQQQQFDSRQRTSCPAEPPAAFQCACRLLLFNAPAAVAKPTE